MVTHPRLPAVALALLAALALPSAAGALSGRTEATPTGWWHLYGVTPTEISDLINSTGGRLIDLEVESTAPLLFTATFVHNSGPYAVSGWWWYYGVTANDIVTFLNQNQARLIELRRYQEGGQDRFACVMVRNTGAEAKAWWWLVGSTAADLSNFIADSNARLVSLSSFLSGGTRFYDAVMISNTGADAMSWWWYYGVTGGQVASFLNTNQARLFDWEIYTEGGVRKFSAVMVANTGASAVHWWWYYDTSVSDIVDFASQNGARVFDIESYVPDALAPRQYGALMINNSNALTTRIAGILGYGSDGATGLYLKKVGGPVLASLQPDFVFEPASTIKGLIALHFMRRVEAGAEMMGANHSQFTAMSGSCPLDASSITESFRSSLWQMLKNSDNARAQFFRQRYGNEAINLTGTTVVGMQNSALHHRLGCADSAGAEPNELTLADAGLMYEEIFDATVLTPAWRDSLGRYLVNETNNFPIQVKLEAIVDLEAASQGMTAIAEDYKAAIRYGFKAGSYELCSPSCLYYYSIAGWALLPTCGARLPGIEYAFGTFIHGGGSDASASNRLWTASAESFREEVRSGLAAWWDACIVAVEPRTASAGIALSPPWPSPANGRVALRYTLPFASTVRLTVHDPSGRRVATLVEGIEGPGERSLSWDTRDAGGRVLPSGLYFLRLQAAGEVLARKLVVGR
jgi:hypothetical protein